MHPRSPVNAVERQRRAGVLLHPTSFPGPCANGDIGHMAYRFIEFLQTYGFKVWQMLPLGPTHNDGSPYQCLSAHAGNPLLISLDWLKDKSWLDFAKIGCSPRSPEYRQACLVLADETFHKKANNSWKIAYEEFCELHAHWLKDFSLFMALKHRFSEAPWYEWPDPYRQYDPECFANVREQQADLIERIEFEQFIFFTQWHEIRDYARDHQVELFGDIPIFVARDSAEVWAKRENFLIDEFGNMDVIAGVPPDAFSATGQRWGNPLYDWEYLQNNRFEWWKERFATQLELFDMVRIDHFRGLQACWQIPEKDDTAMNGEWVEVPGKELLEELYRSFNHLPLIAEDLGVITDEVIALKDMFNLPGMKVLQFAFDGNTQNPHLPHNHKSIDLVYTGTHDNDTTMGWVAADENYNKSFFEEYVGCAMRNTQDGLFKMLHMAFASVSFLTMIPFQDVLMLGSEARMNMPGTVGDNWNWRFEWEQIDQNTVDKIAKLISLFQR